MGLRRWLVGIARGEVSPSGLAGMRAAGAAAYTLNERADELRAQVTPWEADVGTQLFLVYAWNAFALQAVADHMLDAEAAGDTPDVVPQATLAFVHACYAQVPTWSQHARFVEANPAYRSAATLPAPLPAWPHFEDVRPAHLDALHAAYDAIAPRAEYEWHRLVDTAGVDPQGVVGEVNLVGAQMQNALEVSAGLHAHARSRLQLQEVCDDLVNALRSAYTLGQLTAMPSLVERLRLAGYRASQSAVAPLAAVAAGWPVVDAAGAPVGTVARLEGEPALGRITGLVVSGASDRRVRTDQVQVVEHGLVRLRVDRAELERA